MIKNFFLTIIMDKKAMKELNAYKTSFFVRVYIVILILFEFLLNYLFFRLDKDYTLLKVISLSLLKPFLTVLYNLCLGYILYLAFYLKEKVKIKDLIFKTIISMNFLMPILCLITIFSSGPFITILIILYDFWFVVCYIKANIELDLSEKTLKTYIAVSFILTFILLAFIVCFVMFLEIIAI